MYIKEFLTEEPTAFGYTYSQIGRYAKHYQEVWEIIKDDPRVQEALNDLERTKRLKEVNKLRARIQELEDQGI